MPTTESRIHMENSVQLEAIFYVAHPEAGGQWEELPPWQHDGLSGRLSTGGRQVWGICAAQGTAAGLEVAPASPVLTSARHL